MTAAGKGDDPFCSPAGLCHLAAIGLGSNLGPSRTLLLSAWKELGRHPGIKPLALSAPYRSLPHAMASDRWFVNAAALIRTRLSPHALLACLQAIETRHGRVRDPRAEGPQDRTLDLDLLFFDTLMVQDSSLVLPHPRLGRRLFVLAPLAEIAPGHVLSTGGVSIEAMHRQLQRDEPNQKVERTEW